MLYIMRRKYFINVKILHTYVSQTYKTIKTELNKRTYQHVAICNESIKATLCKRKPCKHIFGIYML